MSNSDALVALRQLRSDLSSGQIDVDEAYAELERLTYLLTGVTPADERFLGALVNDIEKIRFTRLPENRPTAVDEVLVRAEELFERCV